LIHRGAIGDQRKLRDVINTQVAQGIDRKADILQGNAGIQQALNDLKNQYVTERVQTLRTGTARSADGRIHQIGARAVGQLAVGNTSDLACDGYAVANLLVWADIKKRFLIRLSGFFGYLLGSLFDVGVIAGEDRKSTRLNSSHVSISYAVFCLKKKKNKKTTRYA